MASGRQHDRATWLLALPFGLLWGPALGPVGVAVAGLAFLAGGLLLSPDLDTRSNAMRRWGPLQPLWWPYRRLLSHRSLFSHSPLLGMGLRLAYLAAALLAAASLLQPLGLPAAAQWIAVGRRLWQQQPSLVLAALVALEASSWLHLIQDGDPIPRLPRPLRALGRWRRGRR
ncbi:MAG: DUF2227 family putative metal-binding protein [Prochlorococcaceae cyanobacterium]